MTHHAPDDDAPLCDVCRVGWQDEHGLCDALGCPASFGAILAAPVLDEDDVDAPFGRDEQGRPLCSCGKPAARVLDGPYWRRRVPSCR